MGTLKIDKPHKYQWTIPKEEGALILSFGDNMKNSHIEVLEVFYKENLTADYVSQAFDRLLYLCHWCVLSQALSMLKLIFDVVVEKNITVNKNVIDTIKSQYGYCDLSF